jgi:DNA-binding response OmpR family regulator
MGSEADLSGCRILVVEDDFHLAADIEHALRAAKAEVLGPVSQEDQALALLDGEAPTCALVDINLGRGVQFRVADALKARGVPFMLVTGYDDVMIPERFNDIGRLRKPTGCRLVVRAAAQMCSQRSARGSLQAAGPESPIHR